MARDRSRIIQATAFAAAFSGAPSTLDAFRRDRELRSVVVYIRDATCAVGTLLPPGRPGFIRGALIHVVISAVCGEALARGLPENDSVCWGAAAGLAMGVVNVGIVGRRFPAIRALPLVPQLADNLAFGAVFALVLDRQGPPGGSGRRTPIAVLGEPGEVEELSSSHDQVAD